MAKQGLNDIKAKSLRKTGMHSDGGGLYLQVNQRGYKSWVYRYRIRGRLRNMGLGPFPAISLKEARVKHADAKRQRDDGIDPIIARGAKHQVAAKALSVEASCESYITAQQDRWKTKAHVDQIRQRLRDYVTPVIGHLMIAEIGGAEARQVLTPIWKNRNPTARRLRQHLEEIVNWAIHEGVRKDENNPFEVKRLKFALPFGKHEPTSHPSLPFEQAPGFLTCLREVEGVKARALEFTMLCATRIADITGGGKAHSSPMRWQDVDLDAALWTIPVTKTSKMHSVPLSAPALRLLNEMQRFRDPGTDYVFPGANAGTSLHQATLRHMLKAMGHGGEITTHGMRATFRTWASECTNADKDVIEACLAHAKGELDAAYHRGTFLAKRRHLMDAWADYLEGRAVQAGATVVALR